MGTIVKAVVLAALMTITGHSAIAAQIVSGTLYEDSGSCSSTNFCAITFQYFPSSVQGKMIRFDMVSCNVSTSNTLTRLEFLVAGGPGTNRTQYVTVPGRTGAFTFNQPVYFTVGGNTLRYLGLYLNNSATTAGATLSATCVIDGTILN